MATHVAIPSPNPLPGLSRSSPRWKGQPPQLHRTVVAGVGPQKASKLIQALINERVIALLPLVRKVALPMRERLPGHIELDDLISTGVIGLVDAVKKFDASKKVKLEQYAQYRIRGAILDGLRGMDHASRDMRRKNKNAERVYADLESKLGRPPNDLEMAKALGVSLKRWYRTVAELKSVGMEWLRPLASVGAREAAPALENSLPANNEGHQFEACYLREQKEILQQALERIPDRERQVVELYYHQGRTMREIGDRLGIDESRVSQLHSCALERLRRRVKDFLSNPVPLKPRFAW